MSAPSLLGAPAEETQMVRLFGVAAGSPEEARLTAAAAEGSLALSHEAGAMLGGLVLDPAWIELIDQADVESMGGLEAYLRAGYDPPETALEDLRPALEIAPRRILLVLSRAFAGQAARIRPMDGLSPLAIASLMHDPPTAAPMPADDAPAPLPPTPSAKPAMSQARISGMVALAALLVAGALVVVMVLVAG